MLENVYACGHNSDGEMKNWKELFIKMKTWK